MTPIHRIWVTRAQPGADRTAARLTTLGYRPVVVPLLEIRSLPQPEPDLSGVTALAFTSANGMAAFAALTDRRDLPVFTVGDATAEAARAAGFAHIASADGAAADLARLLDRAAPPGPVLAPGPREPAADLSALAKRAEVRPLPVYETVETDAAPPQTVDAVLVQSPRAARALATLWPTLASAPIALAQSAAIAEPLLPLTTPRVASAPTEAALFQMLGNPPPGV